MTLPSGSFSDATLPLPVVAVSGRRRRRRAVAHRRGRELVAVVDVERHVAGAVRGRHQIAVFVVGVRLRRDDGWRRSATSLILWFLAQDLL